ncbi:MAG TPA: YdiU family protein [Thermohalobaculum sp.]|nr:YdiU family protein [Thermohalobaculum sp.]
MTGDLAFGFDNSFARLPDRFFARMQPTPVPAPRLVRLNAPLARHLGLDPERLALPDGVGILAGNRLARDAAPLSMAYAGHQFGVWVPQLGDGRAILLGEVIDRDGVRRDIQLKGSGRTPFSRMGDGRAVLGPVLREYIVSEAMAALGIPTTRALAAVSTGEEVMRERPLPGAILTRVARSHVRVGTFQCFAARRDTEALRLLADYVIERHYPDAAGAALPCRALLDAVVAGQAELVARWMLVGFVHGVMNTDNTSVACETIDYGPCAFLDAYHPQTVFSSIDHQGRYAYANQPHIVHWNLACLAQALLPLLGPEEGDEEGAVAQAQEAVDAFPARYDQAWLAGVRAKLGLAEARPGDRALAEDLLARMAEGGADFTLTFRRLCDAAAPESGPAGEAAVRGLFADPAAFDAWAVRWRQRLAEEGGDPAARQAAMRAVNPVFIPRNHRLEEVLRAAVEDGDLAPLDELMEVLAAPCDDRPGLARYAEPPPPGQAVHRTFCGT